MRVFKVQSSKFKVQQGVEKPSAPGEYVIPAQAEIQ
jgi:hypothetical protein